MFADKLSVSKNGKKGMAGREEHNLPDRETDDQMTELQRSQLTQMTNDMEGVETTGREDIACVSANALEPGIRTTETSEVALPEVNGSEEKEGNADAGLRDDDLLDGKGLEEREEKYESRKQMIVSTPSSENSQQKRSPESKSDGHKKRNKSSDKIKPALPRRASKRLAGIQVDVPSPPPLPEPKTRRQATTRGARGGKTSTATNLATPKEHDEKTAMGETPSRGKQVDRIASSKLEDKQGTILPLAGESGGNVCMDNRPNEKQGAPILSPPADLSTIEKIRKKFTKGGIKADVKQELRLVTEIKADGMPKEKQVSPTALPLMNRTTPEIAYIVVPLASSETETNNEPHEKQGSTVVNAPTSLHAQEDSHGGLKTDIKPESPVNFYLWTDPCIEFAVKTLTGDIPIGEEHKIDNFLPSAPELALEELCTDPCIEFAVKTLTGAIPVGEDTFVQDYLQHQATSSSGAIGESSFSSPDAGMNNFSRTAVLSKHFEVAENRLHNKQQDSTMLPNGGNGGPLVERVKGSRGRFLL